MAGSVEDLASKSLSITSLFAHLFPVLGLILQSPPPVTKTGPLSKIHARPKTEITQKHKASSFQQKIVISTNLKLLLSVEQQGTCVQVPN